MRKTFEILVKKILNIKTRKIIKHIYLPINSKSESEYSMLNLLYSFYHIVFYKSVVL